jgi:hypothetical protein
MNIRTFVFFLLLIPALAQGADRSNLRGQRYCEIIIEKTLTTYAVYNTIGLNDCPESIWNKISVDSVKKEMNVSFVHLNGPRYWVIDGLEHSKLVNTDVKVINDLSMREAGVLKLSLLDLYKGSTPYKPRAVERKTTWVYQSGKPVYELINPKGEVFVMQSYSIQKTAQTLNSLNQLNSLLKLPKGWIFKTGILKTEQTVTAINNLAVVIQDDFLNTYQQATHDLLE